MNHKVHIIGDSQIENTQAERIDGQDNQEISNVSGGINEAVRVLQELNLTPEAKKSLIDRLGALKKLNISHEIIGSLIWVDGKFTNSPHIRKTLKRHGFRWMNKSKKAWYYHHESTPTQSSGNTTFSDLRKRYPSKVFKAQPLAA